MVGDGNLLIQMVIIFKILEINYIKNKYRKKLKDNSLVTLK